MRLNTPTWITLFRVVIIPFFVVFFYLPCSFGPLCSALIFAFSSLTDWLDGFLARRWEQTTLFGAFLDPITDKLLVIMAFILIVEYFHIWWITLPIVGMVMREIIISALREWVARVNYINNIVVSKTSKIKTTLQMVALTLLLWHPNEYLIKIGAVVLYFACILTLWSILEYFYILCQYLKK